MADDFKLHNYQDDLDNDPNKVDKITHEQTDELADTAGIPEHELAHELKRLRLDDLAKNDDDMREHIEDMDEESGSLNEKK